MHEHNKTKHSRHDVTAGDSLSRSIYSLSRGEFYRLEGWDARAQPHFVTNLSTGVFQLVPLIRASLFLIS